MANRVPIDLSDIRERIENARSDSAWRELSLSKKVRILLQERLEQIEEEGSMIDKGNKSSASGTSNTSKARRSKDD
jgi:hypothetical protein